MPTPNGIIDVYKLRDGLARIIAAPGLSTESESKIIADELLQAKLIDVAELSRQVFTD